MEEVQIEQARLQMMQTQLQEMDTQQVIQMGGTMAVQAAQEQAAMEAQGAEEGGSGDNTKSSGKKKKTPAEKKTDDYDENTRYKVTFLNRNGKKQTETMKGSTLKKQKSAGISIQNVEPLGEKPKDQTAENVKRALG